LAQQISLCDPKGPLCVNITKLFTNEAQGGFYAFGRIFSGTLKVGDSVKVMGEGYTLEEEEDLVVKRVNNLWISEGRYKVEVDKIGAGNWVLIDGVD
jgi:U5 small nuclear ribonucleoprotein component